MSVMISIIIPVYNAEKYIERTVNSILNQETDNDNIEIILVDDGSVDQSYVICKKIARENKNILLIHTKNRGVSCARNLGIERASGEWISFLDADDYFLQSALVKMKQCVSNQEEMYIFNYKKGNERLIQTDQYVLLERNDAINITLDFAKYRNCLPENMRDKNSLFSSCWAKLYKKSIIDMKNIKFPENLTLSEDLCFNLLYLKSISKVKIINTMVYNYFVNPESVTHTFSFKSYEGREKLIQYLGQLDKLPNECENSKLKYILVTVIQLADKVFYIDKSKNPRRRYFELLDKSYVKKAIYQINDNAYSFGEKQNQYYAVLHHLLKHGLYNSTIIIGHIYSRVRG